MTAADSALRALLNHVDDGLGDTLHMTNRHIEGGVLYPGEASAGVEDMMFGYEITPCCELDEDGVPLAAYDSLQVRLEVRQRGVTEGDQIVIALPCDPRVPLGEADSEAFLSWLESARGIVGLKS